MGRRPQVECIIVMGIEATVNLWEYSLWPLRCQSPSYALFYVLDITEFECVCGCVPVCVMLVG